MASEAYKRLMKRIPLEVQQRVNFNMEVAHEIHQTLKDQCLTHVDLAKRLGKYESEISKWLTGTHNFTMKTIQKIELVLGSKILMTKSAKIDEYEAIIAELEEKCTGLEIENSLKRIKRLKQLSDKMKQVEDFTHLYSNETVVRHHFTFQDYFTFYPRAKDNYKLEPLGTSTYNVEQHFVKK